MLFSRLACNGKGWWTYTNTVFLSSRRHNLPPKLKLRNNQTKRWNVDVTIILSERAIFTFPTVDVYSLAAQKPLWRCESRKMATLMNSSFFVFKTSLLRNYRVKYYDYIVNGAVVSMLLVRIAGYFQNCSSNTPFTLALLIRSETGFAPMRACRLHNRIWINELSRFKLNHLMRWFRTGLV